MHATASVYERIGVEFSGDSDEVYAYTLGYIVKTVLRHAGMK